MRIAVFIVSDRNGAAPVALAGNEPIAHTIGDFRGAVEITVDKLGLDDGEVEFLGKLTVAVIIGRDGHDGAGAVAGEDVIGDVDWDLLFSGGVNGVRASEDAGLFFILLAFDFGFFEGGEFVGENLFAGVVGQEIFEARVFWGDYEESSA